jgi:hypothetical protein
MGSKSESGPREWRTLERHMESLINSIKQQNVVLFVGAGVSMNLGLLSWKALINKMAEDLGFEPGQFNTFGDYLALAEYYKIRKGSLGGLRSWMDRTWHSDSVNIAESEVHRLIVETDFPIIYTTNYDRWLEISFDHYQRPYTKITNVTDLVRIREDATQIVKFHGDFDDDRSLVLDETSYFERLEFESPLDIKLRSDVLARSVLFIGYSLSDVSLRYLFYKLDKLWKTHGKYSVRPRSYIFVPRPNPVQEAVLDQWGISMISSDKGDPKTSLVEFLQTLRGRSADPRLDSPSLRAV